MDSEYQELLKRQDWERIVLELLKYCTALFRRTGMSPNQIVGKARVPEDIVSEAIEDVLSGKRRWNPQRGELVPFIKFSIIRNKKSNLHKAKERKTIVDCLDAFYTDKYEANAIAAHNEDFNSQIQAPADEALISKEACEKLVESVQKIDDAELEAIFECMRAEIYKPADIEKITDIPARRISELKRKLFTRLRATL